MSQMLIDNKNDEITTKLIKKNVLIGRKEMNNNALNGVKYLKSRITSDGVLLKNDDSDEQTHVNLRRRTVPATKVASYRMVEPQSRTNNVSSTTTDTDSSSLASMKQKNEDVDDDDDYDDDVYDPDGGSAGADYEDDTENDEKRKQQQQHQHQQLPPQQQQQLQRSRSIRSQRKKANNPIVEDDDDEETHCGQIFDPSLMYIADYKCFYWDSKDRIRKGKMFLTSNELLFKCSRASYVQVKIAFRDILNVVKINNYKHRSQSVLSVECANNKTYAFFKFRLPKSIIKNIILQLVNESKKSSTRAGDYHTHSDNDYGANNNNNARFKKMSQSIVSIASIIKSSIHHSSNNSTGPSFGSHENIVTEQINTNDHENQHPPTNDKYLPQNGQTFSSPGSAGNKTHNEHYVKMEKKFTRYQKNIKESLKKVLSLNPKDQETPAMPENVKTANITPAAKKRSKSEGCENIQLEAQFNNLNHGDSEKSLSDLDNKPNSKSSSESSDNDQRRDPSPCVTPATSIDLTKNNSTRTINPTSPAVKTTTTTTTNKNNNVKLNTCLVSSESYTNGDYLGSSVSSKTYNLLLLSFISLCLFTLLTVNNVFKLASIEYQINNLR